ncbi:hypothetical protein [Sphingobium olei]|uniref:NACHT domain-containing protein n=1 Tax=Sphingobium olei TaxID=420955 RepID=A0ABW3NZJ1_9SPHN
MTSIAPATALSTLKAELQALDPAIFERLVAALVGKMIGIGISVAKSGFQHGADGGTAGRQGRRLRIETKRYADTNPLNERELLGELEQASQRDSALELWVLGATREAKEQLETSLFKSGLKLGIPVLVIDWKNDSYPGLAALCAYAPAIVTEIAGAVAGDCANQIAEGDPMVTPAVEQLRRDLSAWQPGVRSLEERARHWLNNLWTCSAVAVAALGQDAAGGADATFIERKNVIAQLDDWFNNSLSAPATVVGDEGMGKTWATLGWFAANADQLAIPLVIPSGAVPIGSRLTVADVKALLASRLFEITSVQDQGFWAARLEKLLARPDAEGPVFMLLLDGLNQATDAAWVNLHQQLQVAPFAGRVRIVSTCRPLFLESELRNLVQLVVPPRRIDIGPYDLAPGGEFDQLLLARGLKRSDIREELVPHASVPRLFDLVLRLRDQLNGFDRITVHGLLWEYGRDSLGIRNGRTFSEIEWREWLQTIAGELRAKGSSRFTRGDVERSAYRPTLAPNDVFGRLSDIVDSQFSDTDANGRITLRPSTVAHALGAAILTHLSEVGDTAQAANSALDAWLGPISGLSERGEILRAAVAILCASPEALPSSVANVVVSAWLSTQNLPENHRDDVAALSPQIAQALLYAVETITTSALAAARDLAIDGLRTIPRDDLTVRGYVVEAVTRWMRIIPRDVDDRVSRLEEAEENRAKQIITRTGSDKDGKRFIFGLEVEMVPRIDGAAFAHVPALLEGYPLAGFIDLFELAALHLAVRGRLDVWNSLKWLTLWNELDFRETAAALLERAEDLLGRTAEPGVEPLIANRIAALLLWLSNDLAVEHRARDLNPRLDAWPAYEDYEADPVSSLFRLERRHAELVLRDTRIAALARARRLQHYWWDPTLVIGDQAIGDMKAVAQAFETSRFNGGPDRTAEDLDFEHLAPALARCSPASLAQLARCRLIALASMDKSPPALGDAAYDALLIGNADTQIALKTAREAIANDTETDADEGNRQLLLQPDLLDLNAEEQVEAILAARFPQLFTNANPFLKPLDAAATERLVTVHRHDQPEIVSKLALLLSLMATELGPVATEWLEKFAFDPASEVRRSAFTALARCQPEQFAKKLWDANWSWTPEDDYESHVGSMTLAAGTLNYPFELVAPRLAPHLIASTARKRGGAPAEVALAAEILDRIVRRPAKAPDQGPQITINVSVEEFEPSAMTLTVGSEGGSNPLEELKALLDQDQRAEAARRAVEVAEKRIKAARSSGASLYLVRMEADDLALLLDHASVTVDAWLEGLESQSPAFKKRVRLAEGFFIALTEALLKVDLDRGVALWIGVKASLHSKFVGVAGIDKMVLMLLSAPPTDQINDLLQDLLKPHVTWNDDMLLDIAVAAAAAGREDWLLNFAAEDRATGVRCREERGKALEGFSPGKDIQPRFADGRETQTQIRDAQWGEVRYRDHAARHWWNSFWTAGDGESAFAAWTLLATCADRRAIEWMHREWPEPGSGFPLMERKRLFAGWRIKDLTHAAKKIDQKTDKRLFGRDIVNDVAPWSRRAPLVKGRD